VTNASKAGELKDINAYPHLKIIIYCSNFFYLATTTYGILRKRLHFIYKLPEQSNHFPVDAITRCSCSPKP
jgi:hypothetical protein